MKHFFNSLLVALALVPAALQAQTVPPVPPAPPSNLQGVALRDWYRQNWYDGKRVVLSYSVARGKMYNYIDNFNNTVTCVYSGYSENVPFSTTNTSPAVVNDINCEHSIPQSWFNEVVRMQSDIHHLFPTREQWNSDRGSDPFADIPDASTLGWLRNTTRLTTIPTSNIDEYSEDTNTEFEPREDHKGDLARAAFYFYTMHANETFDPGKNVITALGDLATFYRWHLADPVSAREIERNNRVAASQGNFNPYINYPNSVATAWNLAAPGPTFSFATTSGSINEGSSGGQQYTVTVNLSPAATTPVTVQLSVNTAASTATAGSDFGFTSPPTLTFPAGSTSQTFVVTVNGDSQPEADETVVLELTNASTGSSVGGPNSHTLTITNDDGPAPTVAFASATGAIVEGNTGTTTYTVNVVASGTLPTGSFTVPVTVETAGTTATGTTDYVLNTTSLTFSSTALTQAITVTVNGDATFEANETVRLRLGTPSDATILVGQPNAHTLTITNDDTPPPGAPCTKPYFSQYMESSTAGGNTKVLEIYNPTGAPLSLAGKRVELFANGATTPTTTQALSGTIAPGDVYVIANTGVTNTTVAAQVDLQSDVAFFNGDDAIALFDGIDTLDVIGVIGQRPTSWTTAGGGSTLNNTLVRLPNTSQGGRWNGPYGASTWTGGGVDNIAGIGSYTSSACINISGTRATATLRNSLELYPNPTSETVQVRLPGVATTQAATIAVLDLLGRPVRQRAAQLSATNAVHLDLRGLPAGIYAVRVTCATVEYTGRVVVR